MSEFLENSLVSNMEQSTYSSNETFDESKYAAETANRIITKYRNRIPVLIWSIGDNIKIRKRKFIVPKDLTLGQFLYVLRKQMDKIDAIDGVFIFVHATNTMIPVSETMAKIYEQHNVDGFLRLSVVKENTFG